VLVNNLGGSSNLELGVAARAVYAALLARGVHVQRLYCGTFMTALAMAGVSITVAALTPALLSLLDVPTAAPAWPAHALLEPSTAHATRGAAAGEAGKHAHGTGAVPASTAARLVRGMRALLAAETQLNALDAASGDGDCGTSMAGGARAVLAALDDGSLSGDGAALLAGLGATIEPAMGGTSGALFAIMLAAAAGSLAQPSPDAAAWAAALAAGVSAASRYGGAQVGDRTMLDALIPAVTIVTTGSTPDAAAWQQAALAAQQGAEAVSDA
jgi:triose/dihydroxyacetone kinase / FAD-AMP lyase (cyclizing)